MRRRPTFRERRETARAFKRMDDEKLAAAERPPKSTLAEPLLEGVQLVVQAFG